MQKGFVFIELVIILIVVGALAVVGTKYWQARQLAQVKEIPVTNPGKAKPKIPCPKPYLDVTQWKVCVPLAKDMAVTYRDDGKSGFGFRTKAMDTAAPDCKTNTFDIQRGKAADAYHAETADTTFEQAFANWNGGGQYAFHLKLGDYYYLPGPPGASCTQQPGDATSQAESESVRVFLFAQMQAY